MTSKKDMEKLTGIANMVLDKRLNSLQKLAMARNHSLALLDGLNARPIEGPEPVAEALVRLRYIQWADTRRAAINLTLAAQTAGWMQARADALRAFGQAEVLKGLCTRKKRRPG